jgi:ABC-type uncharacterized transport system ATPase subunit
MCSQIVEILKRLLYRGADVLILDEPTAVLARGARCDDLFRAAAKPCATRASTIIFISHKLDEVLAVADEITVIRNGRVVASLPRTSASRESLAELMIGEVLARPQPRAASAGAPVFEVKGLSARDLRGHGVLSGFDLTVRAGEIVGIAGVAGNGQDEIVAAATALGRIDAGSIRLDGLDVTDLTLAQRRARGLAYLSPDRAAEGLCLAAPIAENAIAGHHRRPELCSHGVLRRSAIARHVADLLDRYSVRRASDRQTAGSLSGGNQQRVAVARELDGEPKLLVACQPTRGVDIRGIDFIHRCLIDYRDRGGAVLLVSEELEELVTLSDRIVVVYGGRITGEVARGAAGLEEIGRLMLGGRQG